MLPLAAILTGAVLALFQDYQIDGEYEGCEYGRLYGLVGGGILECQDYSYSYDYFPEVIARGSDVILIGDERVSAIIHQGDVFRTRVASDFEGCDFERLYRLDNGLIFECNEYHYAYDYRPEVLIFAIPGRQPVVKIDGRTYRGSLLRR